MSELVYRELSYILNGIFFDVQNKLGTKFQEKHYVKAVAALLKKQQVIHALEVLVAVVFEDEILGKFKVDMAVDSKILIEFKATNRLTSDHRQKLLRYLQATKMKLGLLVNFRIRPLQIWRVVN